MSQHDEIKFARIRPPTAELLEGIQRDEAFGTFTQVANVVPYAWGLLTLEQKQDAKRLAMAAEHGEPAVAEA